MRLIDANKLLEWRHTFASDFGRTCAEMFISAIDQEETIEIPNKWIPVSERLPEEGARVFVTQTFGERTVVYCTIFPFEKTKEKYILAWMPLPEPYKEGATDETTD